jgi:hypothetical protein
MFHRMPAVHNNKHERLQLNFKHKRENKSRSGMLQSRADGRLRNELWMVGSLHEEAVQAHTCGSALPKYGYTKRPCGLLRRLLGGIGRTPSCAGC